MSLFWLGLMGGNWTTEVYLQAVFLETLPDWIIISQSRCFNWKDLCTDLAGTQAPCFCACCSTRHRVSLFSQSEGDAGVVSRSRLSRLVHAWVGAFRCPVVGISHHHTLCISAIGAPLPPPSSSCSVATKRESVSARKGEWQAGRRRAECSVPAGDKGVACQRPHSSELTHATNAHHTHSHTHTHAHS